MKVPRMISLLAVSVLLPAAVMAADVDAFRNEWARIRYEMPAAAQQGAMAQLKSKADEQLANAPDDAGLMIWDGIITSTLAGLKGGVGALGLVKEARATLERAEKVQPGALNGSALTSLGALYYQVPRWPLGFGDHDKARKLLQAALKIDPDGIDSNYFYADFLFNEGDLSGARQAAVHALAAAPRPGRELADNGRRGELRDLMARIAKG